MLIIPKRIANQPDFVCFVSSGFVAQIWPPEKRRKFLNPDAIMKNRILRTRRDFADDRCWIAWLRRVIRRFFENFKEPPDHPPQPGDPTPIICEITPRTQNAIFHDGIRVQELAAFFRRPDLSYESTGHKAHKVRLIGYPFWDDEHNEAKDVGATIRSISRYGYHNPWRATAWEIHPVIKIDRLN